MNIPSERGPVLLLLGGGMAAGKSTVREVIGHDDFWSKASSLQFPSPEAPCVSTAFTVLTGLPWQHRRLAPPLLLLRGSVVVVCALRERCICQNGLQSKVTPVLTCMEGTLIRSSPHSSVRALGMVVLGIPVALFVGQQSKFPRLPTAMIWNVACCLPAR